VLVVPDQDLALVPFEAFPEDATRPDGAPAFLGDRLELAVLPMAGVPEPWRAGEGPVLLAGDPLPDAEGRFPALALAGDELDGLARVWNAAPRTELRRERLSAAELRKLRLGQFHTLHFATHAVASSLDPRRCAVVLSRGEHLAMRDVAALELGPALVVLSACRTGEGEVVPGEGVVGLSWAFLRAGARGVTASLWSVEDASTAEWMAEFHRRLRAGDDPPRAAAAARRAVAAARPHPAYWAPFAVILNPRS
jgi:CHAT domain-containing protein